MQFKFEKLQVWQLAVDLSMTVHEVTKQFPKAEIFILTSQIKRAADSVSLNIAEGSTGQSNAEFKRFLGIAIRSNMEVVACIYLAKKRSIIDQGDFTKIYSRCHELSARLYKLKSSIH